MADPVSNSRELCFNPRTKQYKPVLVEETVLCVDIELGTDTERGLQLTEQPSFDSVNYPVQVKRDSDLLLFTETNSDTISATEFLVDYATGSGNIILASSTSLGESFTVTYYSIGSLNIVSNIFGAGTLSQIGSLDAGSRKIVTLADATIASGNKDAATGGQIYDEQQARISADNTLQTNIDTATSDIADLGTDKVSKSGDTMTGDLTMSFNRILQLTSATTSTEPATYGQLNKKITDLADTAEYNLRIEVISVSGSSGTQAWNRGIIVAAYLKDSANEVQHLQINDPYYFRYATDVLQFEWNLFNTASTITVSYLVAV